MSTKQSNKEPLLPGREYPRPGEEKIAAEIVKLLQAQMTRLSQRKKKQPRQIHPKMNGCVKAELIVEPGLPPELSVGLFKEARSYPAWIRFSNGKTRPVPDWKKDIRGVGIKVMNVPGKKLKGKNGQDLILMNTKGFVCRDVGRFAKILKVVTTPTTLRNFFPKLGIIFSSLPVLLRAKKGEIRMKNPAEIPYFSTVPFRFGDETKAVKYAIFPHKENQLVNTAGKTTDLIKENLVATLGSHQLLFDFCVQFQTDPEKMPVEDPTVEWSSEFKKVATIRIPAQVFDTPERQVFGEDLAYDSWHCLPEHQPIGNFNRAREIIYREMYTFRLKWNNEEYIEPVADENFFNDTKR